MPDARNRAELWTPRVWPGAVLVKGEIVGTWRRSRRTFTIQAWRRLSTKERDAVVAEAESLPLPDPGPTVVHWVELVDRLQEPFHRLEERLLLLHVRHVARLLEDPPLRARDARLDLLDDVRRRLVVSA